jgi:BASS family bile acid:Na+ symporter
MALLNVLTDVKVWVVLGIVLGLAVGFDNPNSGTILMIVLMIQMTLALDGLHYQKEDFVKYRKSVLISIFCCFVVNTSLTIATGLLFIHDTALWYGWIMLAAVPCAVSLIPGSLFMHGDTKMAVLSLVAIYMLSLALSPLITKFLIGDAIEPLDILKYIILFIIIPFILTVPLGKLHLPRAPKIIGINVMMFLLVAIGLGSRRDYIFSEPGVIMWLTLASILRVFVFSIVVVYVLKKSGCRREHGVNYMVLAVWRNSSMAVSMCMVLLAAEYPEAVLPSVISLVVEAAWFAFINSSIKRLWPEECPETQAVQAQ